MPKKIPRPDCQMTVTFRPTATRVQADLVGWIVRARVSSSIGDSWIVVAETQTYQAALDVAYRIARPGHYQTDGRTITSTNPEPWNNI